MKNRTLLVFSICFLVLALLCIIGFFVSGSFGSFISGMSPFVLLGLSLLSLIFSFQDPGQNAD